MIFSSVNESGEPAWKMVLDGRKTITRRRNPIDVGTVLGVRATRTGKELGKIRVVSCVPHMDWQRCIPGDECDILSEWAREVKREGFNSLPGLLDWLTTHGIDIEDTFRIEFEVVDIAGEKIEPGQLVVRGKGGKIYRARTNGGA